MRTLPKTLTILAVLLAAGLFPTPVLHSQDAVADAARELLEKFKSALVVVTVDGNLIATTDGDPLPDREQQRRTLGVTIRENGLVVISNASIDPSVGLVGQKARMGEKVVTIQSAKTEFEKVEISYGDSTVLPGKIIRQDAGADVAFVLPDVKQVSEEQKTFSWIDLESAKLAEPADQVVGLSRSSAAYGYMPTVILGRVTGVFKSDRTYFVTTAGTAQGIPIFTIEGNPIGVTLERVIDNQRSGILGTLAAGSIQVMANLAMETYEKAEAP